MTFLLQTGKSELGHLLRCGPNLWSRFLFTLRIPATDDISLYIEKACGQWQEKKMYLIWVDLNFWSNLTVTCNASFSMAELSSHCPWSEAILLVKSCEEGRCYPHPTHDETVAQKHWTLIQSYTGGKSSSRIWTEVFRI